MAHTLTHRTHGNSHAAPVSPRLVPGPGKTAGMIFNRQGVARRRKRASAEEVTIGHDLRVPVFSTGEPQLAHRLGRNTMTSRPAASKTKRSKEQARRKTEATSCTTAVPFGRS